MNIGRARSLAADWVASHAGGIPGFRGAFLSGSVLRRPLDAEHPATSDVDVLVAVEGDRTPPKLGKFRHGEALLEVTYLPLAEIADAERVLGNIHLAGCFRVDGILADPTGHLRELHRVVSREFARPHRVRKRLDTVLDIVHSGLSAVDASAPWHRQVTAWLFPTGIMCFAPLVAARRDPTVRLRYPAARDVLTAHGRPDVYEELLAHLGCAGLGAARVAHHADALAELFDATAPVARTPFPFSADITPEARPVAVDGSRELIARGEHREAVFWIVATAARCHAVLDADAPGLRKAHDAAFAELMGDLGIAGPAELAARGRRTIARLPALRAVAEEIAATAGPPPGP